MFDKPIDFKKLHKALSDTYKRQMEIKKEFPHRYQDPPWAMWDIDKGKTLGEERKRRKPWFEARKEFNDLSFRMTILCCILNHAKGKLHMKKLIERDDLLQPPYTHFGDPMTLEIQAALIGDKWEEFAIQDDTDNFGVSEADEKLVEDYMREQQKPVQRKSLVARFAEALGLNDYVESPE